MKSKLRNLPATLYLASLATSPLVAAGEANASPFELPSDERRCGDDEPCEVAGRVYRASMHSPSSIKVCFLPHSLNYPEAQDLWREQFMTVVSGSWGEASGVSFWTRGSCRDELNEDSDFRIEFMHDGNFDVLGRSTTMTDADGDEYKLIQIKTDTRSADPDDDWDPFLTDRQLTTTVHEAGHGLGFTHSHPRKDAPRWCIIESRNKQFEGGTAAEQWGRFDADSVLTTNYCGKVVTSGEPYTPWGLSWMDAVKARRDYGVSDGTLVARTTAGEVIAAAGGQLTRKEGSTLSVYYRDSSNWGPVAHGVAHVIPGAGSLIVAFADHSLRKYGGDPFVWTTLTTEVDLNDESVFGAPDDTLFKVTTAGELSMLRDGASSWEQIGDDASRVLAAGEDFVYKINRLETEISLWDGNSSWTTQRTWSAANPWHFELATKTRILFAHLPNRSEIYRQRTPGVAGWTRVESASYDGMFVGPYTVFARNGANGELFEYVPGIEDDTGSELAAFTGGAVERAYLSGTIAAVQRNGNEIYLLGEQRGRLANVPESWTCDPFLYDNGSCYCGCGAPDPDCETSNASECLIVPHAQAGGCSTTNREADRFDDLISDQNWRCVVPPTWTCSDAYYADGLCDCGCGAFDPDCVSSRREVCEYWESGSCGRRFPPEQRMAETSQWENWVCWRDQWTCPEERYGDGVCDCGCGVLDPDCDSLDPVDAECRCDAQGSCAEGSCSKVRKGEANSVEVAHQYCSSPPSTWTCANSLYSLPGGGDDECDCGCGAHDPACVDNTARACTRCGEQGTCNPGDTACGAILPDENMACFPTAAQWFESHERELDPGDWYNFGPYEVQPGDVLNITMSGSGDADLYVREGAYPTTSNYDCRPYDGDSNESCEMDSPGTYYVAVRGYDSADVQLDIVWQPTTLNNQFPLIVEGNEWSHYGPIPVASAESLVAEITGSGDADLYLREGARPTSSQFDCRPYIGGSRETCTWNGEGDVYVSVRGYLSSESSIFIGFTVE